MPYFGRQTVGASFDTCAASFREAQSATAVAGHVINMYAHLSGDGPGTGDQAHRCCIWDDNGSDAPNNLLGVSIDVTVVDGSAGAWVQFPFTTVLNVTAVKLWYGMHHNDPTTACRISEDTSSGIVRYKGGDVFTGGTDATFGTEGGHFTGQYDLYVEIAGGIIWGPRPVNLRL